MGDCFYILIRYHNNVQIKKKAIMLNKETKAALINMSMDAETLGYCPEIVNLVLSLIQSEDPKTREEIIQFLYCHQGAPLKLFFEIMRYLPSVSNEPVISYKIK